MSGPLLPRRTRAPRRIEIGTGEPTYPVTAQDYYRRIYFELILVNPATSAAGERSFSTARRLKTWLRSRMNQERFSNLTV